jgi:hypothetical protein
VTTRSRTATTTAASTVVSATASARSSSRRASTPPPPSQVVRSTRMRDFLDATKRETVLVGSIERMLLDQGDDAEEPRRSDVLHVSELAKSSFCPRAAYLRITGAALPEASAKMRLQAIFEEGHDVHAKWQRWVRRLGRLWGRWLCVVCESSWMATSPDCCPQCGAPGWKILYKEVPVDAAEEYFIVGHGDGQLDGPSGPFIEAKTIGIGTVRVESARLLTKHSHKGVHLDDIDRLLEWVTGEYREEFLTDGKMQADIDAVPPSLLSRWVDFDGLWKNLRNPFPSHLRQGHLYGALSGAQEVLFIYEYKPNQAHKEFVVKTSPSVYEPLLEMALDVKWAVENKRPPKCPHGGCKECTSEQKKEQGERETGHTPTSSRRTTRRGARAQDSGPDVGGDRDRHPRDGRDREDGTPTGPAPRRRVTRTPRGSDSAGRQPTNGAVHEVRGLGRLLSDNPRSR